VGFEPTNLFSSAHMRYHIYRFDQLQTHITV